MFSLMNGQQSLPNFFTNTAKTEKQTKQWTHRLNRKKAPFQNKFQIQNTYNHHVIVVWGNSLTAFQMQTFLSSLSSPLPLPFFRTRNNVTQEAFTPPGEFKPAKPVQFAANKKRTYPEILLAKFEGHWPFASLSRLPISGRQFRRGILLWNSTNQKRRIHCQKKKSTTIIHTYFRITIFKTWKIFSRFYKRICYQLACWFTKRS